MDLKHMFDLWPTRTEIRNAMNDIPSLNKVAAEYISKSSVFDIKPWNLQRSSTQKNPCFIDRNDNNRSVCFPYFYISAFSKCGTTDLWTRLTMHPLIRVSGRCKKEIQWWNESRLKPPYVNISSYLKCFQCGREEPTAITVDGSPTLLWRYRTTAEQKDYFTEKLSFEAEEAIRYYRLVAPALIYQFTPEAKFIISIRNPIDKIYSHYLDMLNRKFMSYRASQWDFHNGVLQQFEIYQKCLRLVRNPRTCAFQTELRLNKGYTKMRLYDRMYVLYISDVLKIFPRQSVLILKFDEYVAKRRITLEKVLKFLDIDTGGQNVDLVDKMVRMEVVVNARDDSVKIGKMWPETRRILKSVYQPFNDELATLLGDDFYRFEED
jgi:N-acetylgalactosamine 4-sulfate 6-O-sulfotransferase